MIDNDGRSGGRKCTCCASLLSSFRQLLLSGLTLMLVCLFVPLLCRLREYIDEHEPADPLIHSVDKKNNPWAERSKCIVF